MTMDAYFLWIPVTASMRKSKNALDASIESYTLRVFDLNQCYPVDVCGEFWIAMPCV